MRLSLAILVLFGRFALGAQVIEVAKDGNFVAVSHGVKEAFALNDYVCIYHSGKEMACGTVVKTASKGAIFKVDFKREKLHKGDTVALNKKARQLASVSGTNETQATTTKRRSLQEAPVTIGLGVGVAGSPSYLLPLLHLHFLVTSHISFGIEPTYISQTSAGDTLTLKAFGAQGTINYFSQPNFNGVWGQLGMGLFFFKISSVLGDESANSFAARALIGYRTSFGSNFNVGGGIGAQFISAPTSENIEFDYSTVQPLGRIDVGLVF